MSITSSWPLEDAKGRVSRSLTTALACFSRDERDRGGYRDRDYRRDYSDRDRDGYRDRRRDERDGYRDSYRDYRGGGGVP